MNIRKSDVIDAIGAHGIFINFYLVYKIFLEIFLNKFFRCSSLKKEFE